jgi:hypothetical protein
LAVPFKLIFFVLVDGWSLVAGSLMGGKSERQAESELMTPLRRLPSLRANGSAPPGRANARPMTGSAPPDDRLREAIQ